LETGRTAMQIRTRIGVDGFTESEATEGLPYLLSYLQERSWLLEPKAVWDREASRIIVETKVEGSDPNTSAQATLDDVWDCVIAAIHFSSERIHFELIEVGMDE
jgi:hypothetical protein